MFNFLPPASTGQRSDPLEGAPSWCAPLRFSR